MLPERVYRTAQEVVTAPRLSDVERRLDWLTKSLAHHVYADLRTTDGIHANEFKVHSQHGEDGIILWLFSHIGTTDRRFVEFGVEDGRECNTANLSVNWGWSGLLLEPDPDAAAAAERYYATSAPGRVAVREEFVTPENINDVLGDAGFVDEFDLLSIDIDSHDYWVWEATRLRPRVVIIEYNASFGPDRAVTIPYDAEFRYDQYFRGGVYHGASLAALTTLSARKSYSLVGCDSQGANAFFVRQDCLAEGIVPTTPAEAWRPSVWRETVGTVEAQAALLADLPVVDVT